MNARISTLDNEVGAYREPSNEEYLLMDMNDEHENVESKFNDHYKPIIEALHFNYTFYFN